jgi:DNA invertase Pin-like site-specific DNA recombinase
MEINGIHEGKIDVCAYCRVSTDSKDQENSLENQKSFFERELNKDSNYKLVGLYADKGISGTSLSKREQFNQMLYDAGIDIVSHTLNKSDKRSNRMEYTYHITDREPKFKYILTKNTSRFARNIEVVSIIRKLKEKGVYIIFMDISKSTENDADEMLLQMLLTIDENDSRDKSRKVRFGIQEGANKGIISSHSNIFGYTYIKEENRLVAIEHEAEIIRGIFEMYASGIGIRRILKYLRENDIKTRAGKDFCKSSISRILENEKYAGINARLKYDSGVIFVNKQSPKKRPKEEWIINKSDRIEAIISEELFNNCQNIRESKVGSITQRGQYKGVSEFAGLIKCSCCGNNYIKMIDKGRTFYKCSLKKSHGLTSCANANVNLTELDDLLEIYRIEKYKNTILNLKNMAVRKLSIIMDRIEDSFDTNAEQEVLQLKEKLDSVKKRKERLLDLYLDDTYDKETLDIKNGELLREEDEITNQINELSKDNFEKMKDIEIISNNIEYIESLPLKDEYTRDEVMSFINFIEVRPYPHNGKTYPEPLLNTFYHIKRNGKIVGLVDISTKIDGTFKNIMMKYKEIDTFV